MTNTPIRWTRVLFGAALTLIVAMSPLVYVIVANPSSAQASGKSTDSAPSMTFLSGISLSADQLWLLVAIAIAVTATLAVVTVLARSQRTA